MRVAIHKTKRPRAENTIALINIVFLMLIFFLIAGSLSPPMEHAVELLESTAARPIEPPNALFVTEAGVLLYRGKRLTAENHVAFLKGEHSQTTTMNIEAGYTSPSTQGVYAGPILRLASDAKLPATRLIDVIGELKTAGAGKIVIIAERKRQ